MTLADLRTLTTQLLQYDLDSRFGSSPSNSELDSSINWALRSIGRKLFLYDPRVAFTTSNTGSYSLEGSAFAKTMLSVDRVTVSGSILRDYFGRFGTYSMAELDASYPTWRTAASGTPVAAMTSSQLLVLHPAPSGAIANSYVSGQYLPASLAASGDIPDLPTEVHECIAYLAAINQAMPNATEQEQWERLNQYNAAGHELIDMIRQRHLATHRAFYEVSNK